MRHENLYHDLYKKKQKDKFTTINRIILFVTSCLNCERTLFLTIFSRNVTDDVADHIISDVISHTTYM